MLTVTSEDDVERHTKRQIRYCKSQLYKAFVISDVCNRSLCVIPCRGQDKTRQCWSLIQPYVHRLYPNNLKS